jgi:hypothetical protein
MPTITQIMKQTANSQSATFRLAPPGDGWMIRVVAPMVASDGITGPFKYSRDVALVGHFGKVLAKSKQEVAFLKKSSAKNFFYVAPRSFHGLRPRVMKVFGAPFFKKALLAYPFIRATA